MGRLQPHIDRAIPRRPGGRQVALLGGVAVAAGVAFVVLDLVHQVHDDPQSVAAFRPELAVVLGALALVIVLLVRRGLANERRLFALAIALHHDDARLELQGQLLSSEGLFRAALEQAPEGVFVCDRAGRVVTANRAAYGLFAYPDGALPGRALADLVAERGRDAVAALLEAPGGAARRQATSALRADGKTFAAELSVAALAHRGEEVCVVVVRDLTAWVEDREALVRDRDEALACERATVERVAAVSEASRTLLERLVGLARALEEEPLAPEPSELVHHVHASARALVATLGDSLDAAQRDGDEPVPAPVPFDLVALVEDALLPHYEGAERKGLELVVSCTSDLHRHVVGDPRPLRRVANALFSNALRSTHAGHVKVGLETRVTGPRGVALTLRVEDTGVGLPADRLDRIFERRARSDGGSGRDAVGTGLGLADARDLARRLGGDLVAASPLGGGAVFTFTAQLEAADPPAAVRRVGAVAGARLLVALPARVEREALVGFLASHGALCVGAASAAEAGEHLASAGAQGRPFAVVLADKDLPGAERVALAAAGGAGGPTRVVLVARLSDPSSADEAAALGVWRVVRRPLALSRLLPLIARAAEPGASRAPTTEPAARPRAATDPPPPFVGRRVLVVEDNPTNQRVAEIMIRKLGCDVAIAADGHEALAHVRGAPFDLVFMDCQLPELDGYDATREIRSWGGAFATLPIIALTASAAANDRDRSLAAGMNDHLAKPITRDAFRASLTRWLPPEGGRSPS